ncbi:hypothetical protein EDD18DRAFT_49900 [Armillaria luteobubalina]|uniref:Uncharacterized protein n=1 Tax=Armillaria luteobubalina TaxID=153913 RepID=A0AA39UYW2_9AGAR|nr:hypothetical protein EDD18DRAFT_49900 [Armillaria luteobubalina]
MPLKPLSAPAPSTFTLKQACPPQYPEYQTNPKGLRCLQTVYDHIRFSVSSDLTDGCSGRHHAASTSIPAILGDLRGLVRNDHRLPARISSSDFQSFAASSSHDGHTDIQASENNLGSLPRKQKGKLSLSIPHIVHSCQAKEGESSFPSSTDPPMDTPKHGFRMIGRGRSGSSHTVTPTRPKTRKSEPYLTQAREAQLSPIAGSSRLPLLPVNTAASPPPQTKLRYSGRGGAGSKPRSLVPKPPKEHSFGFGFRIPARWKGKAKVEEEEEEEEADNTAFIGDSDSDVSSIHFAEPRVPLPKTASPSRPHDGAFEEANDEERWSISDVIDDTIATEEPDTATPSPIPWSSGLEMQQRKMTGEHVQYPKAGFIFVPKNYSRIMSGRIVMPLLPPLLPVSDVSSSTMSKGPSRRYSLPVAIPDSKSASTLGTFENPQPCEDDQYEAETTPVSSMIFSSPPSPAPSLQNLIEEVSLHTVESEGADDTLSNLRPDSPFVDSIVPISPPTFEHVMSEGRGFVSVVDEKQGWMGQWNRGNIREVISALREL